MKRINYLLVTLISIYSIISCNNDDDFSQETDIITEDLNQENDITSEEPQKENETLEGLNQEALILGQWKLTNVEITNSLVNFSKDGIPVELSFSAELINPENNTYIETYFTNPNIQEEEGSTDIKITETLTELTGEIITTNETQANLVGFEEREIWWNIPDKDLISKNLDSSNETFYNNIIELNETTLTVSSSFKDFAILNFEPGYTGDFGNITYTFIRQ